MRRAAGRLRRGPPVRQLRQRRRSATRLPAGAARCQPRDCDTLMACGSLPDGCGGVVACDGCGDDEACDATELSLSGPARRPRARSSTRTAARAATAAAARSTAASARPARSASTTTACRRHRRRRARWCWPTAARSKTPAAARSSTAAAARAARSASTTCARAACRRTAASSAGSAARAATAAAARSTAAPAPRTTRPAQRPAQLCYEHACCVPRTCPADACGDIADGCGGTVAVRRLPRHQFGQAAGLRPGERERLHGVHAQDLRRPRLAVRHGRRRLRPPAQLPRCPDGEYCSVPGQAAHVCTPCTPKTACEPGECGEVLGRLRRRRSPAAAARAGEVCGQITANVCNVCMPPSARATSSAAA